MAASVRFEDQIEVPYFHSLAEFRQWALSSERPEKIRTDYVAGCVEVDLSPALGSDVAFGILCLGPAGYEPAPTDADHFQYSATFHTWFRLVRHRHAKTGHWAYDLQQKLPADRGAMS